MDHPEMQFGPGPINVPKLSIKNIPGTEAKYKDRAVDDEFLWDQEINERAALDQQQRQSFINYQKNEEKQAKESLEREDSAEGDSGESNEEEEDNKSGDEGSSEDNRQPDSRPLNRQKNDKPPRVNPDMLSLDSFEEALKDYDDVKDPIATVPWDDRPKNRTEESTLSERIKSALPSLPKIPFLSMGSSSNEGTTTQRSILRRMLGVRRSFFRTKRDTSEQARDNGLPFMTANSLDVRSSEQCRILYNGCDLTYEQIMQVATNGEVLIEGDIRTTTEKPFFEVENVKIKAEDDEADQAMRDFPNRPHGNNKRPFQRPKKKPGFGFKVKGSKYGNSQSPFNKIKAKPQLGSLEQDEQDSLSVPSLPILPMRFTWGRPNFYKGRPPYPNIFNDLDSRRPTPPPTPPTTTTPPPPIFVGNPVYKKVNRTATSTNIVPINSTHALQIVVPSSKPFRPIKTQVHDKNGRPSSFASVFTEIAGSSGGLHDFFDKIANTVGHQPSNRRPKKQFSALTPVKRATRLPAYRIKPKRTQTIIKKEQDDDSKSEEDEEEDEVADDENVSKNEDEDEEDEPTNDDIVTKNDDQEDEVADDEPNESSEEKKDDDVDVDLPEGVPDHIREAILEDIRTKGKKNEDGPDKPEQGQVQSPGQGQGHNQGPPQGQGPPPGHNRGPPQGQGQGPPPGPGFNQQRPGPPPQHQGYRPGPPGGPNRPPPRRGMFSFL